MVLIILYVYIALASFAALLYLPKLIQFRYAFKKPPHYTAAEKRKIAVVIPARGESKVIGDLFASIDRQTYDRAFFTVNVIVKDADDPTIELARAAGARVFIVPNQSCKGDALDGYFSALKSEFGNYGESDAFVIVDADAVLHPDYLTELNNALESDEHIFITRKYVKNYFGGRSTRTVFSNCSALTWPIIDDLGNKYRMENNMPLNLCGQGMMVRRVVIEKLNGWPYRTLTEDYELKVDSLVKGFRSTFCPYAIIYTEEALKHRENFIRRMRWITGYSQCDKKYKKQIREQVKERGSYTSGEFEYFFGIVPLILFLIVSIVTILVGVGLSAFYAVQGDPLWWDALLYLIITPLAVMYLLLFAYSILAMCACPEMFAPLGFWEKFGTLLFNPFYLLEYVPIYVISRIYVHHDSDAGWKPTERITYGESEEGEGQDQAKS